MNYANLWIQLLADIMIVMFHLLLVHYLIIIIMLLAIPLRVSILGDTFNKQATEAAAATYKKSQSE